MRLTCPNCQAQYEVDARAIPPQGRDVQCSNCSTVWFQEPEQSDTTPPVVEPTAPEPQEEASEKVIAKDDSAPVEKTAVEDSILGILREEAEREKRARQRDRMSQIAEFIPEAGFDDTLNGDDTLDEIVQDPATPESPEEDSDFSTELPDTAEDATTDPSDDDDQPAEIVDAATPDTKEATEDTPEVTGAEMLRSSSPPDMERINSKLIEISAAEDDDSTANRNAAPERSGFSSGFALVIVAFGLAATSYTYSPTLVQKVPSLHGPLAGYVQFVDGIRSKTDGLMVNLVQKIESI